MGSILSYSLLAGGILIPLYLIIRLCLSRCTFFKFNRGMLLCSYFVALTMPLFLHIASTISFSSPEVTVQLSLEAPLAMTITEDNITTQSAVNWWLTAILLIYSVGLLFFILRDIIVWTRMLSFIAKCRKNNLPSGWILCSHDDTSVAPFSWGRYIVMSQNDFLTGGESIIRHESMHLQCRHWLDLILAESVAVLLWYNPVGWLMRNELQTIHEYEADEAVLNSGINARDYQILLIKKAVGSRFPSIANSLDHSNLSKRIKMMLRKKSSPRHRWLAAAAVPAVALCALVALSPSVVNALDSVSQTKVTEFKAHMQEATPDRDKSTGQTKPDPVITVDGNVVESLNSIPSEEVKSIRVSKTDTGDTIHVSSKFKAQSATDTTHKSTKKMPQYPDGDAAMMEFIMDNIKYPAGCTASGRVIIQFVVNENGTIGETKVIRKVSPELDTEAERVVKMLKMTPAEIDGKPVKAWYTLPILFKHTKNGSTQTSPANQPITGEDTDNVFTAVDEMPQFPGGMTALTNHLSENITYPETAFKNNIQGRVVVKFVINKDGSIGDTEIVRGIDTELDTEAIRVVKTLPKFIPGKSGGKPVSVWYTIPITFKLTETKQPEE